MRRRVFTFVAMITLLTVLGPVGFAKEPVPNKLPSLVKEAIGVMPRESRIQSGQVRVLETQADWDSIQMSAEDKQSLRVLFMFVLNYQFPIYVNGEHTSYKQVVGAYDRGGPDDLIYAFAAFLVHEAHHANQKEMRVVLGEYLSAYLADKDSAETATLQAKLRKAALNEEILGRQAALEFCKKNASRMPNMKSFVGKIKQELDDVLTGKVSEKELAYTYH